MKKLIKFLILLAGIILTTGCDDYYMVCSLNPFYLEKDIVTISGIEGKWKAKPHNSKTSDSNGQIWKTADSMLVWTVMRKLDENKNPTNVYHIQMGNDRTDSLNYKFEMVIFELKGNLYADFCPVSNLATDNSRLAFENSYPMHTLSKIIKNNNQFIFSWLEDDTMKSMIQEKRVRASFRWIKNDSRFILTGSSNQLTEMIKRYCNEERFVEWENQAAMLSLTALK